MINKENIKKVVLAYSGGLDTSIIIPWLKENYNNCEVIAVSGNVGQADELEGLEEKALKTGASKLYIEDLTEEFVDDFIVPTMKAGAVYEEYLLGTSHASKVFFCNSGAEGNEGIIKTARRFGHRRPAADGSPRYEVITFNKSFHGRTLGTLAATGQEKVQVEFDPLLTGFKYVDFNDLDAVRAAAGNRANNFQGFAIGSQCDGQFVLSIRLHMLRDQTNIFL